MSSKNLKLPEWLSWLLLVIVLGVASTAWGNNIHWHFDLVNIYIFFPLLGLWAWSIIWTHYALGALSIAKKIPIPALYRKVTYALVLGLILLHPGLLAYAQWQKNGSLPPGSEFNYVASSLRLFIVFGFVALLAFLFYEVIRRFRSRPLVNKYWGFISLSQMVAMILIFLHALRLGQNLQSGWFRFYWLVLGLLLIPCFIIVGKHDWSKDTATS